SSDKVQLSLQAYRYTAEFTGTAWAWEFLRRNPHYRAHFAQGEPVDIPDWLLLRFEDPNLDARHADVFWKPNACKYVLPLIAGTTSKDGDGQRFSLEKLRCRVTVQ